MSQGRNIASERAKLGISQQQLADLVGVSVGTISNWEINKFEPQASRLRDLAGIFGCSVDYLLGITNERAPNYLPKIS